MSVESAAVNAVNAAAMEVQRCIQVGQVCWVIILDEKYPETVPSAWSPVWMLSPLLQWLGKQTPWEP